MPNTQGLVPILVGQYQAPSVVPVPTGRCPSSWVPAWPPGQTDASPGTYLTSSMRPATRATRQGKG
uniref:Uncharacterized protein n=1 Tax=Dromaius novaehollandiae TaxID=8790 RepID=A0A8C4JPS3_DRONO